MEDKLAAAKTEFQNLVKLPRAPDRLLKLPTCDAVPSSCKFPAMRTKLMLDAKYREPSVVDGPPWLRQC